MSPTPTPTPPYPPLDAGQVEPSPAERIADAIEHLNATSTTDLDALIDGAGGNQFLSPLPALPFRVAFGHDSVTLVTAPYLIPTLLIGAVITALAVYAVRRVTSPEARARRASKRAATHALYTDLIHDKRERAVKARIAERRARDVDVPSGTP